MTLHLEKVVADAWRGDDPFARARQQQGEIFRAKEGRRTVRFRIGARHYFLKLHQGVGWGEIVKNLLQLRLPVISARNEWRAIERLHQLGVGTMTAVAYGRRGCNPAKQTSFLITDELTGTTSLEALCANWARRPPDFRLKRALIEQVAAIARTLHRNGVNHRDFYLCHLLADVSIGADNLTPERLRLYVVDLHRAQTRRRTPTRWIVKDLGALYFSALGIGLTSRDVLRFMRAYRGATTRRTLAEGALWRRVAQRAKRIHRRDFGRDAMLPLA
ncbi:MAG: lipopolysaccharide core heptose(I) kinase RfaP [bacterium]